MSDVQETWTTEQYHAHLAADKPKRRKSKFNARKVEYDGYLFDSELECDRYKQLKFLAEVGRIVGLRVHPVFVLQPGFKRDGKTIDPITYEADFSYYEHDRLIVEDVKGSKKTETPAFRLKWKMAQYRYPDINWQTVYTEDIK